MNLCTNAAQAIGDDGVIEVRLERVQCDAPKPLLHGELAAGAYVRLAVSDTGSGMSAGSARSAPSIPSSRPRRSAKARASGCRWCTASWPTSAARSTSQSEPGRGTRVAVWLPVAGEFDAPPRTARPPWPRGNGQVVMVVDDERPLVELAEELLAELGYEPVGFDSGERALRGLHGRPAAFRCGAHRRDAARHGGQRAGAAAARARAPNCR